jgi:beta-galactosidase
MRIGAAYYPEHWPRERMATDVAMMSDAGLSVVRVGEFAWTLMEPRPGHFEFGWLDDAVRALDRTGIGVIMGTPTSSPPKWLMDRHPEIYPVDRDGRPKGFGHRHHYSVNAPALWPYVDRLVRRMAERYGADPAIVGWQVDNEIGGSDTTLSYGEHDRRAFIEWLRDRYSTIDELNDAWGTRFSNQLYSSFDEIIVPAKAAVDLHNPGLELDFRRFSSDAAIEFILRQARTIRDVAPGAIVTSNYISSFTEIDYFKMARGLDVVAIGAYPNCNPAAENRTGDTAFYHDAGYGYKRQAYWMLEHQSGTPGSTTLKPSPHPDDLGRWSAQTMAHGAEILLYFRWRTCTFGVEEYWHGILPHAGNANRRLAEVTRVTTAASMLGLAETQGTAASVTVTRESSAGLTPTRPRADVAIILSHENAWIFDVQPHAPQHRYPEQVRSFYRALHAQNIPVDVISPDEDLSPYRVVLAPKLALVDSPSQSSPLSERLMDFVERGGTLVCDWRSGTRTASNRMLEVPPPGPLAPLLGIEIEDYGIIEADDGQQAVVPVHGGSPLDARHWYEVLKLTGATSRHTYAHGWLTGYPAVTSHQHGQGSAWYLASTFDGAGLRAILRTVCDEAGVAPIAATPEGVEVSRRIDGQRELLFFINHGDVKAEVEIPSGSAVIYRHDAPDEPTPGPTVTVPSRSFVVAGREVSE